MGEGAVSQSLPPLPQGFVLENQPEALPPLPPGFVMESADAPPPTVVPATTPVSSRAAIEDQGAGELLSDSFLRFGRGARDLALQGLDWLQPDAAPTASPTNNPIERAAFRFLETLTGAARGTGTALEGADAGLANLSEEFFGAPVSERGLLAVIGTPLRELGELGQRPLDAARAAENARRIAAGLPTLEEETARQGTTVAGNLIRRVTDAGYNELLSDTGKLADEEADAAISEGFRSAVEYMARNPLTAASTLGAPSIPSIALALGTGGITGSARAAIGAGVGLESLSAGDQAERAALSAPEDQLGPEYAERVAAGEDAAQVRMELARRAGDTARGGAAAMTGAAGFGGRRVTQALGLDQVEDIVARGGIAGTRGRIANSALTGGIEAVSEFPEELAAAVANNAALVDVGMADLGDVFNDEAFGQAAVGLGLGGAIGAGTGLLSTPGQRANDTFDPVDAAKAQFDLEAFRAASDQGTLTGEQVDKIAARVAAENGVTPADILRGTAAEGRARSKPAVQPDDEANADDIIEAMQARGIEPPPVPEQGGNPEPAAPAAGSQPGAVVSPLGEQFNQPAPSSVARGGETPVQDPSATGQAVPRRAFEDNAAVARRSTVKAYLDEGIDPDLAERLADNPFLPKGAIRDDVTGYFDGKVSGAKVATVKRAQEFVAEQGEDAVYVSGDIFNLGGLNSLFKNNMDAANVHFRAMTDFALDALRETGADVVPMRTGGDEVGFVVVNASQEVVNRALETADARIKEYARANGFDQVPHAKKDREGEFGIGLHFGTAPIEAGQSVSDIMSAADRGVDASKNRGKANESGSEARAAGLDGQDPGADRGNRAPARRANGGGVGSVGRGEGAPVPERAAAAPVSEAGAEAEVARAPAPRDDADADDFDLDAQGQGSRPDDSAPFRNTDAPAAEVDDATTPFGEAAPSGRFQPLRELPLTRPDGTPRRGLVQMQKALAQRLGRGLDPQENASLVAFMDRFADHLADIGLSFRRGGGAQGQFHPEAGVVEIFSRAIEDGSIKRTTIHEFWHALARNLTDAQVESVRSAYRRAKAAWKKAKPKLAPLMEAQGWTLAGDEAARWMRDTPDAQQLASNGTVIVSRDKKGALKSVRLARTDETYRYFNVDEFFAEEMADRTEAAEVSQEARGVLNAARKIMADLWYMLRRIVGRAEVDRLFRDYMGGRVDSTVRRRSVADDAGEVLSARDGTTTKRVPSEAAAWMGYPSATVSANYQQLADRHPEHYASATEVERDIDTVLAAPDGWYEHSEGRIAIVRRGRDDSVPAVRIDFRRGPDGLRVVSAYRMPWQQAARKMRDFWKGVESGQSGYAVSGSVSPGSLTIAEYLEGKGEGSRRPAQSSDALTDSEESVPPQADSRNRGALESRKDVPQARAEAAAKRATADTALGNPMNGGALGWNPVKGKWEGSRAAMRKAREGVQDKFISLRDLQQDIEAATGQPLDDLQNVYRLENLMHGRVQDGILDIERKYLEPLFDAMRKAGVEAAQLEEYLEARHAEERNKRIAGINPGMPDGGSGLTTAEARAILAGADRAKLEPLARRIDAITADTRRRLLASGVLTQEQFDAMEGAYNFYVPLRGIDESQQMAEADRGGGIGRGIEQRGSGIKRAAGRGAGNRAKNILGEVIADAQRAVIAAEKARVGRGLARLVLANPNPNLWEVEAVRTERKFDAQGNVYQAIVNESAEPDVVHVLIKGKPYRVRINNPHVVQALKNLGANELHKLLRPLAALNRYVSATLTSYNPGFIAVNLARDAVFGTVRVLAEEGPAAYAATVAGYGPAVKALAVHEAKGRGTGKMDQRLREFLAAGGKTGWVSMNAVEDLQRGVWIDTSGQLTARGLRGVRSLGRFVESANVVIENAMRLAYFNALRDGGASVEQAAEKAKNLTVNFNRKGRWGNALSTAYLFFNPAIQGTHQVVKLAKNPKAAAAVATMTAVQVVLAMLAAGIEDEDGQTLADKVPEYVKERNLWAVIPGDRDPSGKLLPGEKDWIVTLPMPFGFNVVIYAGSVGVDVVTRDMAEIASGARSPIGVAASVVGRLTNAFVGATSPVPLNDGMAGLIPTIPGQIVGGLISNRDSLGRSIRQPQFDANNPEPLAFNGRPETPAVFVELAKGLNWLGGGDEIRRPLTPLDWAPEDLQYLWEWVVGGAGRFVGEVVSGSYNLLADPEALENRPAPIAKAFIQPLNEGGATLGAYYDRVQAIEEQERRIRAIAKADGIDAAIAHADSVPYMAGVVIKERSDGSVELRPGGSDLYDAYKRAQRQLKELRTEERAIYAEEGRAVLNADRARRLREIRERRVAAVKDVNLYWNEAVKPLQD